MKYAGGLPFSGIFGKMKNTRTEKVMIKPFKDRRVANMHKLKQHEVGTHYTVASSLRVPLNLPKFSTGFSGIYVFGTSYK